MDPLMITKQLRYEVQTALSTIDYSYISSHQVATMQPQQEQTLQCEQIVTYVYDKLYDIIRRNHIAFTNKADEERFLSVLEPEINNIIIHHIPI